MAVPNEIAVEGGGIDGMFPRPLLDGRHIIEAMGIGADDVNVGSIPLGFLAAALGIAGWERTFWPLWFPLVVFAPFIVDASVTLARRLLRGERVWEAHRQHYYQRLIVSGWTHRRTAFAEYAVMLASAAIALIAARQPVAKQAIVICGYALSLVAMMWLVDRRWKRFAGAAHV